MVVHDPFLLYDLKVRPPLFYHNLCLGLVKNRVFLWSLE